HLRGCFLRCRREARLPESDCGTCSAKQGIWRSVSRVSEIAEALSHELTAAISSWLASCLLPLSTPNLCWLSLFLRKNLSFHQSPFLPSRCLSRPVYLHSRLHTSRNP